MLKAFRVLCAAVVSVVAVAAVGSVLWAADAVVTGEVDDQFQIVSTEGDFYVVADSEKGQELVTQHIGEMVEVVGTITYSDEDDMKIIDVKSFKVIAPAMDAGADMSEEVY